MTASQDFRHIAEKHDASRADRLFRAAISAFCALTRPSRRDIIQLEELCLQLYDNVSEDSRRYVSAVLSESKFAPPALVRRLAGERIEIAAPLLLKSNALTDVDLVALVGRRGASHARVIIQRKDLTPTTAVLIEKALLSRQRLAKPGIAEAARESLRAMMQPGSPAGPAAATQPDPAHPAYETLRATALTGSLPFFETALAEALEIEGGQAHSIVASSDKRDFSRVLKALRLIPEQAFLLVAATFPAGFGHAQAIQSFVSRYEAISPEEAAATLRLYQADAVFAGVSRRLAGNGNAASQPQRAHQVA
ncbi:hypothetical protein ACFOEZ_02790 [Tianweitania populi]|uniref:DUF2336 domain-containing protein n=1 Tax=Tianweitania populi TaxID=1607949 RepID=A0A8J3DMW5_9HYPH|nr:hypothetical protein [Tianweitania populi]GHD06421.1 hypothetical protein GCM10016234_03760 [Tianweitania populi]